MANTSTPIQGIRKRPPSVDFIDNQLHEFHPAFASPRIRFDAALGRYTFWEEMFPAAIAKVRSGEEPKKLASRGFSIRRETGWTGVLRILYAARAQYWNYTGFIGSIKKAAKRTADIRSDVETTLRDFQEQLGDVEEYVAIYATGQAADPKAFESLLENYKSQLRNALQEMKTYEDALLSKVRILHYREGHEVHLKASEGAERLSELQKESQRLRHRNLQLESQLRDERSRSRGRLAPSIPPITQDALLDLLDMPRFEEADMALIADAKADIDGRDQGQVEQLVSDAKFRQWAVDPRCRELLVHGHLRGDFRVSAISQFSAVLVENLRNVPNFRTVVFICSEHLCPDDPDAGGTSLIKSLIVQLLDQQDFNFSTISQKIKIPLLKSNDIHQLCLLFLWLVRQLDKKLSLFIVIDSINKYESPEYLEGRHVYKVLLDVLKLTARKERVPQVKILLTSPTDTVKVRDAFNEKDILSMSDVPIEGRGLDEERFGTNIGNTLFER
ncbi:hypothetical protein G7Z17_g14 [Cylindrodendrum hubeiense]|uniref:Nephrocystin 3-like N-terminal domain-containing protein n=1 Tax=Cylindrodendrum hubeiense TaxID=595255 RepID=A0A9P5LNI1_9HYPO|nr:hypothetical protein G7Z17_g14 [Cylindrodendrum hubeiense]